MKQATTRKPAPTKRTGKRAAASTKKPLWYRRLEKLRACSRALEFASKHKAFADAWRACHNADWLCWLSLGLREHSSSDTKDGCWCKNEATCRKAASVRALSAALAKVEL